MTIRRVQDTITASLGRLRANFERLPYEAFVYWRSITPRRTGAARRRTTLSRKTIMASYPYASRLDSGYSRQAPDGMSRPTTRHIRRLIKGFRK